MSHSGSRDGDRSASAKARKQPSQKRICLLVLGMHRSGTSALTRVLSLMGAALPKNILGPDTGNETGHWEPKTLLDYHEKLLAELDSSWHDWQALEIGRVPVRWREEIKAEIAGIISAEYGDAPLIVVKEPRICRFVGLFTDALEKAGMEFRPILIFRNPLEVARSLEKRDGLAQSHSGLLWLRHVLDAEYATRPSERGIISYHSLLADWRRASRQLIEGAAVNLPYCADDVADQVDSFLSPDHRHNRHSTEEVVLHPMMRDWIAEAYEALLVLERNSGSESARDTLDRIRRDFDRATPVIGRLLEEQQQVHEATAQRLQTEASEQKADAEHLQVMLREREAEAKRLQGALTERSTETERLATALVERSTEAERLQAEAQRAHEARVLMLDAALIEARESAELLTTQLAERDKEAVGLEVALSEAESKVKRLESTLAERDAEAEYQERVLAEAEQQIAQLTAAQTAREGVTSRVELALVESDAEKQTLAARLSERDQAIVQFEAQLADTASKAAALSEQFAEQETGPSRLTTALSEREAEVARLTSRLADIEARTGMLSGQLAEREACIRHIYNSTSWRVTKGPRWIVGQARGMSARARAVGRVALSASSELARNPVLAPKFLRSLIQDGPRATWPLVIDKALNQKYTPRPMSELGPQTDDNRYAAWLRFNALTQQEADILTEEIEKRSKQLPLISVLMPVYNAPIDLLDRAIESVCNQIYQNWELCIVDDASRSKDVRQALKRWARRDDRIRIRFQRRNGNISRATNAAAELATGQFLAFLDHDDEITVDALAEIALRLVDEPEADYVYSDDDKMDLAGRRFGPQFKPDWSPALLLSFMYMGHIKVVRKSLFDELGGFRVGFEGSQDYDFALRMSEKARKIVHIPKVLYHWRAVPGSTAIAGDAKPASMEAGRRAVAEAFKRRGLAAEIFQPDWAVRAKVGIFEPRFPDDGPSVAIIIPIKNQVELVRTCVGSLTRTTYRNFEIVIVDNGSDDPETLRWLATQPHRVLQIDNPPGLGFNFSYINNQAARQVDTDYLLLLNNDTELCAPGWLSQMMGYAQMPNVGAVGARLLFADGTIQHAGIAHGYYDGMAGPTFRNLPSWNNGYMSLAKVARDCAAVTAACMLTPRELYLNSGGLNEKTFSVAYNDVDYCYRLVDAGYSCVYCPGAELFHYEGKSREHADNPNEIAAFRKHHGLRTDKWYNQNLSLDNEHFTVRPYHVPLPVKRPVRTVMVSHNLNLEGAPNSQLEMIVGLKGLGIIDPIVLSPTDGPLRGEYEKAGVPVQLIRSPLQDVHDACALAPRLDELACLYRDLDAEVVYGNTALSFWAIAAAESCRLPSVWNIRESENWETYFDWLPPDLRQIAYGCYAFPYRVVFVAHATRQGWTPLDVGFNYTVIHNGLDLSRLEELLIKVDRTEARRKLGIAPDEVAAILIGTVCDRKGQVDLVRALHHVPPPLFARMRVLIVGDRPSDYSAHLHQEIEQLPPAIRERLTIVPETRQVPTYYRAADIALCTSRIESYPRIILEAMASGLPIITTPVFGVREQVREEVNALFYEPGNVEALASALVHLVEDDGLRTRLASNSRPVLESLTSYPEMLDSYGKVFREARASLGQPWQSPNHAEV